MTHTAYYYCFQFSINWSTFPVLFQVRLENFWALLQGTFYRLDAITVAQRTVWKHWKFDSNHINNSNNKTIFVIVIVVHKTVFMVLSSWYSHCESSPSSFDERRTASGGRLPLDKSIGLSCLSAYRHLWCPHPPLAVNYYLARMRILIFPPHGG